MEPDDRFRKAEDTYFMWRGRLEAGRITRPQFEAALKDLVVQDDQGRRWALGASDGKWYRYDGRVWVPRDPYTLAGPLASQEAPLPPGPAPLPPAPTAQASAPAKPRRGCGCGRIFLILLVIVAIAALVLWGVPRVQSLLPGLRKGDCSKLAPVVRSESATGNELACSFGLADEVTIQQAPSREVALQRIAIYTAAQQQAVQSLAGAEGFVDRSRWGADAAIYDTQATVSSQALFTRAGLVLYRDRYLIQVRLVNWRDDAAMQSRWSELVGDAQSLIDDKFD
jgi:hypothetical protein